MEEYLDKVYFSMVHDPEVWRSGSRRLWVPKVLLPFLLWAAEKLGYTVIR